MDGDQYIQRLLEFGANSSPQEPIFVPLPVHFYVGRALFDMGVIVGIPWGEDEIRFRFFGSGQIEGIKVRWPGE